MNHFSSLWQFVVWSFLLLLLLYSFFIVGRTRKTVSVILDFSSGNRRVLSVFAIGIIEGYFLYNYWNEIIHFFRAGSESELPAWLGPFISTLAAAPIALLIWAFRNTDKIKDLQHAEENIRQADFHKIEEWAAAFSPAILHETEAETAADQTETQGSTDANNPAKHKTDKTVANVLQIAAIYQLLPYVKGEYGNRFMRPAMEIYRSLLSSWQWSKEEQQLAENLKSDKIIKPAYVTALHTIFKQETDFFRSIHILSAHWCPLFQIDLKGTDFRWACLIGADFREADLTGADFREADLTGANLMMAVLREANLMGANLMRANLIMANLVGENLTGANFRGADLGWAKLKGAKLKEADLREANLIRADLREADLREAKLTGTNLTGANLRWAKLKGADLTGAIFPGSIIKMRKLNSSSPSDFSG